MTVAAPATTSDDRPDPAPAPSPGVRAFGRYQPGFDGMRGIGLMAMLAYHGEVGGIHGAYFALSLFFTLSGFLITAILLDGRRRSGRIDLRRFWTRRIRRLAPASLLGLGAAVIFGATVATRAQAERLPEQILGSLTYVVNWVFIATDQSYADLFAAPSPVQQYWSLAIEEQFYLIIPFSLIGLFAWRASATTMAALAGAGALLSTVWMLRLYESGAALDRLYYGTDTRLAEMLTGVMLAILLDRSGIDFASRFRNGVAVAGSLALAAMAWMWMTVGFEDSFAWRGGFLVNAILTAVVIVAVIGDRGPIVLLGWAPLAWIGRLSYGVYIFHFAIFLWLTPERTGLDRLPNFALRVSLSFAVAIASYYLVEMPIRRGASLGLRQPARWLAYPVIAAVIMVGAVVMVDESGADPLGTLRGGDRGATVAVGAPDGVLDILVMAAPGQDDVVDALEDLVDAEETVTLTVADDFSCSELVSTDGGRACANWLDEWPALVEEVDPDSVLLMTADGPGGAATDADRDALVEIMNSGLDLLTVEGAPVVWAPSAATFEESFVRARLPFSDAMRELEGSRDDLFATLSGAMPDPAAMSADQLAAESAAVLLDTTGLYHRADREGDTRVMVIGDSQARSLGYGLEQWGAANDVWVWNAANLGCGIADEGFIFGSGDERPVQESCRGVVDDWVRKAERFDPDVVLVLSSVWDVGRRRLDDWSEPEGPGDEAFDAYLLDEYRDVVDRLGDETTVVRWMTGPCLALPDGADTAGSGVAAQLQQATNLAALNDDLLPALASERPGLVEIFDLDAVLCPQDEPIRDVEGIGPLRSDGAHFNPPGAVWFAENYGRELTDVTEGR